MSAWLRTVQAIAAHDLGRELRRPVASVSVLLFGASSLVVLRLALAGGSTPAPSVLAGALWIVLVFAALLGAARAWTAEREDGALDALLIAPASRSALHAAKVLVALATTLLLDVVLVALYLLLFAAPSGAANLALLLAAVALAAGGFAAVGVLVAGLSMRARGRDLLGPAIFLPLSIPLVIAAVTATIQAYGGGGGDAMRLLLFLAAYDLTFLVAGLAAFPELAVE